MKLRMEQIHVKVDEKGAAKIIVWHAKKYRVLEVQERWLYAGKWWLTGDLNGRRREYWRLRVQNLYTRSESVWEVFRENGQWTLSREMD